MKIVFEGKTYELKVSDGKLEKSLRNMAPLKMQMRRSADHEYYGILQDEIDLEGVEKTSHVKANMAYYFADWKAFSLNFLDMDIAPYEVYVIGQIVPDMDTELKKAKQLIEVELKEES